MTVRPQPGFTHVGGFGRLQPSLASQGNDAKDDGYPQEKGQDPSAPPAGQAAPEHFTRTDFRRGIKREKAGSVV